MKSHLKDKHPACPPFKNDAERDQVIESGRRTVRRSFRQLPSGESAYAGLVFSEPLRGFEDLALRTVLCEPCFGEDYVPVQSIFPLNTPAGLRGELNAKSVQFSTWPKLFGEEDASVSSGTSPRPSRPRERAVGSSGSGSEKSRKRAMDSSASVPRNVKPKKEVSPSTETKAPKKKATPAAASAVAGKATSMVAAVSVVSGEAYPSLPGVDETHLRSAEVFVSLQRAGLAHLAHQEQAHAYGLVGLSPEGLHWLASVHGRLAERSVQPPSPAPVSALPATTPVASPSTPVLSEDSALDSEVPGTATNKRVAAKRRQYRANRRAKQREARDAAVVPELSEPKEAEDVSEPMALNEPETPEASLAVASDVVRPVLETPEIPKAKAVSPPPVSSPSPMVVAPDTVPLPVPVLRTLQFNEPSTRHWCRLQLGTMPVERRSELQIRLDLNTHVETNFVCVKIEDYFVGQLLTPPLGELEARQAPERSFHQTPFSLPPACLTPCPIPSLRSVRLPASVASRIESSRRVNAEPTSVAPVPKVSSTSVAAPSQPTSAYPLSMKARLHRVVLKQLQKRRKPVPALGLPPRSRERVSVSSLGRGAVLRKLARTEGTKPGGLGVSRHGPTPPGFEALPPPTPIAFPVPSGYTIPKVTPESQAVAASLSASFQCDPSPIPQAAAAERGPFVSTPSLPRPGVALLLGRPALVQMDFSPIAGSVNVSVGGQVSSMVMMPDLSCPGGPPIPTPILIEVTEPVRIVGRVLATPLAEGDRMTICQRAADVYTWTSLNLDRGFVGPDPIPPVAVPTAGPDVSAAPVVASTSGTTSASVTESTTVTHPAGVSGSSASAAGHVDPTARRR